MTDKERIEEMVQEIKSVITRRTGENSTVTIVEKDGVRKINIIINNVSSYSINFAKHES